MGRTGGELGRAAARLRGSAFGRSVLTLMTGTVVAQALPVVSAPLLTRLYTPGEFGVFALFLSVSLVATVLANGRYQMAVNLPRSARDAANLVALCLAVSAGVAAVLLLASWLLAGRVAGWLGNPGVAPWLYLVPASVMAAGTYQALTYWMIRRRQYRRVATSRVVQSVAAVAGNVGLGVAGAGAGGLIAGWVAGQAVGALALCAYLWRRDRRAARLVSAAGVRGQARRYRRFPLFSMPADLINVSSSQLPVVLLTSAFGAAPAGLFALTQRVFGMPLSLVAGSILDVFKERASRDYRTLGSCRGVYLRCLAGLTVLSLPAFAAIFVLAPSLFALVFGPEWREAGEFARVLTPMFLVKFIASPLSYTYYIAERQREDLLLHVYMGVSTAAALVLGARIFGEPRAVLALFSANYALIYLVYLARSYRFSGGRPQGPDAPRGASPPLRPVGAVSYANEP